MFLNVWSCDYETPPPPIVTTTMTTTTMMMMMKMMTILMTPIHQNIINSFSPGHFLDSNTGSVITLLSLIAS